MKCLVVIPARLASTRLPKKPLAKIAGKTLIRRVFEKAKLLKNADKIVIATDAEEIRVEAESFGAETVMTPVDLQSGSDRVYYTVENYFPEVEHVVNLQGDEPFINVDFIDDLIMRSMEAEEGLCSAYFPIDSELAMDDSVVKVVLSKDKRALYFSRAPIPYSSNVYNKHIGIYIWKKSALKIFHELPQTDLEKIEKLEQLRLLENGYSIKMFLSPMDTLGIDTPEDILKAENFINEN